MRHCTDFIFQALLGFASKTGLLAQPRTNITGTLFTDVFELPGSTQIPPKRSITVDEPASGSKTEFCCTMKGCTGEGIKHRPVRVREPRAPRPPFLIRPKNRTELRGTVHGTGRNRPRNRPRTACSSLCSHSSLLTQHDLAYHWDSQSGLQDWGGRGEHAGAPAPSAVSDAPWPVPAPCVAFCEWVCSGERIGGH